MISSCIRKIVIKYKAKRGMRELIKTCKKRFHLGGKKGNVKKCIK
jgi:hypothetical protein